MKPRLQRRDRIDHKILFVVAGLVAFGLMMVFSVAKSAGDNGMIYKQFIGMFVCFAGMMFLYHFDQNTIFPNFDRMGLLKKIIILIYVASYGAILALLLPEPITKTVNGATRWINVGPVSFQVAEFVKIAVILMLARYAEIFDKRKRNEIIYNVAMLLLGMVPAAMLLFISNDLSSSLVIAGITFTMCFLSSRGKLSVLLYSLLALGVVVVAAVAVVYVYNNMPDATLLAQGEISFRIGRIAAWLDPERYVKSVGFQPLHCLYAIANGGWLGRGLGQGWQKGILPESENDVIFAVVLEELGIAGGIVLLFLFFVLVFLLYKVADRTDKIYDKMVVVGVVIHIVLQVLIHCAVSTNSIPNTGIGLPFVSYGISAILFIMAEMTLVLWVAKDTILDPGGEKKQEKIRAQKRKRHEKKVKQRNKKAQKNTKKAQNSGKIQEESLPANVKVFPTNANAKTGNTKARKRPSGSAKPPKPVPAGKKKTPAEKDAARQAALMRVKGNSQRSSSGDSAKTPKKTKPTKK